MLHIKIIPSIYGNGKQMKECDNTSWLYRSGLLKKIKVYLSFPYVLHLEQEIVYTHFLRHLTWLV